ncbi:hypothetical protein CAJAP_02740 [Camponotus japonicus]
MRLRRKRRLRRINFGLVVIPGSATRSSNTETKAVFRSIARFVGQNRAIEAIATQREESFPSLEKIQDQSGTEATSAFDWLRVEMITKLPTSILPIHWQQISAWYQQPMSLTVSAINISALLTRNVDNTSGQPISS